MANSNNLKGKQVTKNFYMKVAQKLNQECLKNGNDVC